MSVYKGMQFTEETDLVKGIQFSILSPEDIKARAVIEVTATELFSGAIPVTNGLMDERMGVIDHGRVCRTCESKNTMCTGHFGCITLARPVFLCQYHEIVRKLLRCVCFRCSKLLLDIERPEIKAFLAKKTSRQKRWDFMYKLATAKTLRCGTQTIHGCGAQQPNKVVRDTVMKISMEWTGDNKATATGGDDGGASTSTAAAAGATAAGGVTRKMLLSAEDVLRILRRITDVDAEAMGFSAKYARPEWLICTVLPVPPPAVRPSVRNEGGQRCEDDLSHCLLHIIKTNNMIKQRLEKGASQENIDLLVNLLQSYVVALVDNSATGVPPMTQRTGRPLRALMDRLKGKEGRIRGNLVGKRVDHSARSVITPDPNISIDELGVPLRVAMNLTFPEVVNPLTRAELEVLVVNGPAVYPGAKFLRKKADGRVMSLANVPARASLVLEDGDIVDRHLRNGDYVLFNRQPSLHKMSMMAHRVRVMPFDTFRLNVCVTPTFNADFDGDEMNMHVPQSAQTHEELRQLAAVSRQIITPRESKPLISIVQDITVGVYKITQPHVRITEKAMFNLLAANPRLRMDLPDTDLRDAHGNRLWTGSDALSTIMPPDMNLDMKNGLFDNNPVDQNHVIVRNGRIIQGVFDKSIYQAKTMGLVHSVVAENGSDEARLFFDNTQKLICDWLAQYGFSVGISDMVVDRDTLAAVKETILAAKTKVYDKIWEVHAGSFENLSTKTNAEHFEQVVNHDILNDAVKDVGKVARSRISTTDNRMLDMIQSGAKGTVINFAQMIGCLGNQNVDGKRIQYGFEHRTLPHYTKYDDSPEARGFVSNSFISGLSPQEFFFHAMGGREGLIDTAVKSVTGDTPIIIIEGGTPKYVQIGHWIDAHLSAATDDVAHFPDDRNLELMHVQDVFIPTTDADGHVTWGEMTAVSRHDPGTVLYKITTSGGRSAIVTESKSVLVWDAETGQFLEKRLPDVRVGDFVPVTAQLVPAPVVIDFVDMSIGVEAARCAGAGGDDLKRPRSRSDPVDIDPVTSVAVLLPDRFELDYDNGVFVGLYLADGCCHEKSGQVTIAEADATVRNVVERWFSRYSIKFAHQTKTSIVGYSTLLVRFLTAFVGLGHGERFKYVPDAAFAAPEPFVCGLLSGFFSGEGTASMINAGISACSASRRLIEGVSMLCNRIGVFGKLHVDDIAPVHVLSIGATWARQFASKVTLVDPEKQRKLRAVTPTASHINFEAHRDVVKDPIVVIETLGVENFPKMYDVTVPSTLNFSTFDGLHLRDTSESGYIQRKLVKAMEDVKVCHDYTVRDTTGSIVQFLFGEDGVDPIRRESQPIWYVNKHVDAIMAEYLFLTGADKELEHILQPDAFKSAMDTREKWEPRVWDQYSAIVEDRRFLINDIFKGKLETKISYPIAFKRILENTKWLFRDRGADATSDLTPIEILDAVDALGKELVVCTNNPGNRFLLLLLRCHLAPKPVLTKHRLSRFAFDYVLQQVRARFFESLANPGEMVGVVAAQSIGEPTTQLTVHPDTTVMILKPNNVMFKGTIKGFVDKLMERQHEQLVTIGADSVVLDLEDDYKVIGVSDDEKTSWKRISQLSRHPAHGGMVRVHTKSGKNTCATLSHSFLKRVENGVVPVLGSDLKVGDRTPVARYIPVVDNPLNEISIGGEIFQLDFDFGWICGAFIADGSAAGIPEFYQRIIDFARDRLGGVSVRQTPSNAFDGLNNRFMHPALSKFLNAQFGCGSYNKHVPPFVFQSNLDFIAGLLSGYHDGDGNVNDIKGKQMIRTASASERLIDDIILLMAYFGIFASKHLNVKRDPGCGDQWTAQVSRKYAKLYKERIGFKVLRKAASLDNVIAYVERDDDAHSHHKEDIDKIPEVGDAIAFVGKALGLPGYGRCAKKASIGRRTLIDLIGIFQAALVACADRTTTVQVKGEEAYKAPVLTQQTRDAVEAKLAILRQAAYSDVVWDEIVKLEYLDDPGELVYDFTVPGNDSFMVDTGVLVHNTLNSVHYDTEVLFKNDANRLERVKMGEYIDAVMACADAADIEHHPNDTKLAWLRGTDVKVLSCDEDGKVDWQRVEAVTQHPVVNEDGTNTLLRVVTHSGRSVIATKAKSFLKRVNNKIVPIKGSDLKVGDYLPVSKVLTTRDVAPVDTLDISQFLPHPGAAEEADNPVSSRGVPGLWKRVFQPYYAKGQPEELERLLPSCTVLSDAEADGDAQVAISLTEKFGWVVGEYLKDGVVPNWCNRFLSSMFAVLFGPSEDRRIPAFLLGAPDAFLHGVIGSYQHDAKNQMVFVGSPGLLQDFQQILTRFGICTDTMGDTLTVVQAGIIPDVQMSDGSVITISPADDRLRRETCSEADRAILDKLDAEQIIYDEVVSIEELFNERPWVYDLTVENTRNFNLYNGLCQRDSFHLSGYSGASEAVRGVPRLKELLQVSKSIKTPTMKIYLKPDYSQDKAKAQEVKNMLETTYLHELVTSCSVYYDPQDTEMPLDKPFVDLYKEWRDVNGGLCPASTSSPWVLRLEFERSKMLNTGTTMMDVERVLMEHDKLSCMFSDDNAQQLVARIRLLDQDDKDDMLMELKALEQSLLETVTVKGVEGIQKTAMNRRMGKENDGVEVYDSGTDQFEKTYEWWIDTAGTNLKGVLANVFVDSTRTTSNDIVEIYNVLGIEATRQALHDEIMEVLSDAFVNFCHVSLLVDVMTNKGQLSSINRHGINRTDIGPLAKSSFEMTNDVLVKAGVFAEHDRMTGVSANVMMGQVPRYGTGDSDVYMDTELLSASQPLVTPTAVQSDATQPIVTAEVTEDMFKVDFDLDLDIGAHK